MCSFSHFEMEMGIFTHKTRSQAMYRPRFGFIAKASWEFSFCFQSTLHCLLQASLHWYGIIRFCFNQCSFAISLPLFFFGEFCFKYFIFSIKLGTGSLFTGVICTKLIDILLFPQIRIRKQTSSNENLFACLWNYSGHSFSPTEELEQFSSNFCKSWGGGSKRFLYAWNLIKIFCWHTFCRDR